MEPQGAVCDRGWGLCADALGRRRVEEEHRALERKHGYKSTRLTLAPNVDDVDVVLGDVGKAGLHTARASHGWWWHAVHGCDPRARSCGDGLGA